MVTHSARAGYHFEFGTTRAYGARTHETLILKQRKRVVVSARISKLAPGTSYHYRLVADGDHRCGPVDGADRTFETAPPPVPPTAQTGPASDVGQTTGTVTGTVNPEGRATRYYFSYGPTNAYGAQTSRQWAGSGRAPTTVTRALVGLTALTIYHYRLVATSRGGLSYGADGTFTTSAYYQNPVYAAAPMPDPFVLDNRDGHSDYWAFGTGNLFPMLHSTDLIHWTAEGTAMTARPSWVTNSGDWHPWAPSVIRANESCPGSTSSGCYVMYYVSVSAALNTDCIGIATAPTPNGPYQDQGPLGLDGTADDTGPTATLPGMPIGCGDAGGKGNIDPSAFVDSSGQAYLYVSTNQSCSGGTCVAQPTIAAIPLASDLLEASGTRVPLLVGTTASWEASGTQVPRVEGPFLELHNGTYYLFYSGGNWQAAYGMGYATGTSPTGPFTKSATNPILAQNSTVLSPGGGDQLVTGPHGGLWLLYAARTSSYTAPRTLRLDRFSWTPAATPGLPDVPVINGPTSVPQATEP
jgi:Glycosyl hydrolases family 43